MFKKLKEWFFGKKEEEPKYDDIIILKNYTKVEAPTTEPSNAVLKSEPVATDQMIQSDSTERIIYSVDAEKAKEEIEKIIEEKKSKKSTKPKKPRKPRKTKKAAEPLVDKPVSEGVKFLLDKPKGK